MMKLKRYLKSLVKTGLLCSLLLNLTACTLTKPPYDRTEVEQRIVKSLKDYSESGALTRIVGNTLYIYLPTTEKILEVARVKGGTQDKIPVSFVKTTFEGDTFTIQYAAEDVPEQKSYTKDVSFNYTPYAQRIMNNIYSTINEALTDSPDHFNFFVLYLANIENGIEIKMTINELDLKKWSTHALPPLEFNKRVITEVNGDRAIISDETGRHIEYKDIQLVDFLCDLITYSLRPGLERKKENHITDNILKIFHDLIKEYDPEPYIFVELKDLLKEKELRALGSDLEKKFDSRQQPSDIGSLFDIR